MESVNDRYFPYTLERLIPKRIHFSLLMTFYHNSDEKVSNADTRHSSLIQPLAETRQVIGRMTTWLRHLAFVGVSLRREKTWREHATWTSLASCPGMTKLHRKSDNALVFGQEPVERYLSTKCLLYYMVPAVLL